MLVPALLGLSFVEGWLVLPLAGVVAASIFGQVTVNDTMTARYIAPALRAKLYSVRFTIGFLGAALASPLPALAAGSLFLLGDLKALLRHAEKRSTAQ